MLPRIAPSSLSRYSGEQMFSPLSGLLWLIKGVRVYALVGASGTGKSFRAKLVAQKYGIDMIIDDGLLIRGDTLLAGRSAKKSSST